MNFKASQPGTRNGTRVLDRAATPYGVLQTKVRRVIRAAGAFVLGDLTVWAQRTSLIDFAVGRVRGDDLRRLLALFDPLFHRLHLVEAVRAGAALAVAHSGHHEERDRIRGFVFPDGFHDFVVIDDAVQRIHLLIGPSVIHQQLSAVIEEWLQVRIAGEQRARCRICRRDRHRWRCRSCGNPSFRSWKTTFCIPLTARPSGSGPPSVAQPSSDPGIR